MWQDREGTVWTVLKTARKYEWHWRSVWYTQKHQKRNRKDHTDKAEGGGGKPGGVFQKRQLENVPNTPQQGLTPRGLWHLYPSSDRRSQQWGGTQAVDDGQRCPSTPSRPVTDVLNSGAGPKQWMTDNVARAHRVGQSRDGKPKPMIVKFSRWKDKMTVLSNRQFRDNLETRGTKVANDMTRNQASKFLKTVAAQYVDICLKTRSSLLTLTREIRSRRACKPTKLE